MQLGAAGLHDAAEVHAAGTHALAVAAHQALLNVLAVRRVGLYSSLVQRLDEMDAAARRLGFMAGEQIGGAVLQAEATVHALGKISLRWRVGAQTHKPSGMRDGAMRAVTSLGL